MSSNKKAAMEEGGFTYVSHKRKNRKQRRNTSGNTAVIYGNSKKEVQTPTSPTGSEGDDVKLRSDDQDSHNEMTEWISSSIQKSIQDSIDESINKSIDASIDASIEAMLAHQLSKIEQNDNEMSLYEQQLNDSINEPLKKIGLIHARSNRDKFDDTAGVLEVLTDVYSKRDYVERSDFFSNWIKEMHNHLNTEDLNDVEGRERKKEARISKIVCLGIGSFQSNNPTYTNARFQLAALLALQNFIEVMNQRKDSTKETFSCLVEVFDPLLEFCDRQVIKSLKGFTVGRNNNEGKTCLAYEESQCCGNDYLETTMFFMPHCSMRLYSNVLWSNWGKESLSRILIIGNSFASYETRLSLSSDKTEVDDSNCVLLLRKYVKESKLWHPVSKDKSRIQSKQEIVTDIKLERAFNDTSMMSFRTDLDGEGDNGKLFETRPPEYKENQSFNFRNSFNLALSSNNQSKP